MKKGEKVNITEYKNWKQIIERTEKFTGIKKIKEEIAFHFSDRKINAFQKSVETCFFPATQRIKNFLKRNDEINKKEYHWKEYVYVILLKNETVDTYDNEEYRKVIDDNTEIFYLGVVYHQGNKVKSSIKIPKEIEHLF